MMKTTTIVSLLSGALTMAVSATALAESESDVRLGGLDRPMAPVPKSLELAVAVGYTQGFGDVSGRMPAFDQLTDGGGSVELQAGVRVMPNLTLGGYGSFSSYRHGDSVASGTDVFGATAGLMAAWHFRPDRSIDPWVSFGAGWRGMWLSNERADDTFLTGVDFARLQLGCDLRVTPTVAISSVTTVSMTTYLGQYNHMNDEVDEIGDKEVSVNLFSGIMGRFDIPVGG
jgi:hypothetical protein